MSDAVTSEIRSCKAGLYHGGHRGPGQLRHLHRPRGPGTSHLATAGRGDRDRLRPGRHHLPGQRGAWRHRRNPCQAPPRRQPAVPGNRPDTDRADVRRLPEGRQLPPGARRREMTAAHGPAAARARAKAVTNWLAAREDSSPPGPAAVGAAVGILAAPPHQRDVRSACTRHRLARPRPPGGRPPFRITRRGGGDRRVLMPQPGSVRAPARRPSRNRAVPVSGTSEDRAGSPLGVDTTARQKRRPGCEDCRFRVLVALAEAEACW